MSAAASPSTPTPPREAPPALDAEARLALYRKYGEKIRPRLVALALVRGAAKDRAHELAQETLFEFLDGRRSPRIDPDDEYESLALHLLGVMRSKLDTRSPAQRGRTKITTTGSDAVMRRDGDVEPKSAPGLVLEAPSSRTPERLVEMREAVRAVIEELRAELPGDALAHRLLDVLHLDLDPAELADRLGVSVLTIYKTNRRLEEAKARLAKKKQKKGAER